MGDLRFQEKHSVSEKNGGGEEIWNVPKPRIAVNPYCPGFSQLLNESSIYYHRQYRFDL